METSISHDVNALPDAAEVSPIPEDDKWLETFRKGDSVDDEPLIIAWFFLVWNIRWHLGLVVSLDT